MSHDQLSRRSFLRGQFVKALQTEQTKLQGANVIRPPWADLSRFADQCTACNKCLSACEMQILTVGQGGLPEVNFTLGRGECSFCEACVNVCEEAIFRPTSEAAWQHKVEIQASCLALNGVECRACEDNCEARAIRFKREIGGIAKPTLNFTACNGCGACLRVCPVQALQIRYPV